MTITEFLEARIAEDEAFALAPRRTFGHEVHLSDPIGAYSPRCPDCVGVHGGKRMAAECAAKRVLIGNANYTALNAFAAIYSDHPDYRQDWDA